MTIRGLAVLGAVALATSALATTAGAPAAHALLMKKTMKKAKKGAKSAAKSAGKATTSAAKSTSKAATSAAKSTARATTTAAKATAKAATTAAKAVANAANFLIDIIKKKIKELSRKSLVDILDIGNKLFARFPKPIQVLIKKIAQGLSAVIGPLFDSVKDEFAGLLKKVADKLAGSLSCLPGRRRGVAPCGTAFAEGLYKFNKFVYGLLKKSGAWLKSKLPNMASLLGKAVAKGLKFGMLELLTGKVTKIWATMKKAQEYGAAGGSGSTATAPKSITDRLKQNFATPGKMASVAGIAVVAKIAEKLVEFPTAYLVGASSCIKYNKGSASRDDYKACYLKAFQGFTQNWLFQTLVGTAIAPVEALLLPPIATSIGTTVTSFLASTFLAMTAGVGATIAPVIGVLTMAVVNFGFKELIKYGMQKGFYGLYKQTTWKKSCGFFKNLVSADVIDHFGAKAGKGTAKLAGYKCP